MFAFRVGVSDEGVGKGVELQSLRGSSGESRIALGAARKNLKPGGYGRPGLFPSTVVPGVCKWEGKPSWN